MGNPGWPEEQARLWRELVPRSGQAATIQGEVIRCTGRLADEAYRNGNINWDFGFERMARFVGLTLDDAETFTADERAQIRRAVSETIDRYENPDLSGTGSPLYYLTEMAVRWCLAHPAPIARAHDPDLHR